MQEQRKKHSHKNTIRKNKTKTKGLKEKKSIASKMTTKIE